MVVPAVLLWADIRTCIHCTCVHVFSQSIMQHYNKKPETRTAKHFVEGTIKMTAKGMGFVFIDDEDDQIYIDPSSLGLSLNGDRVRVAVYTEPANGKAAAGAVTEVLERAKTTFVGVIEKKGSVSFLKPQNSKIHVDFFIPPNEADKAESGQKVLIELVRWEDPVGGSRKTS